MSNSHANINSDSDSEPENVCEKCGKKDLDLDNEYSGDKQECPICLRGGPWCSKCLLHHYKHDNDEDDIPFDEDCSDCDE